MANYNPGHKAVLDDLLLGHPLVRPGKMFGFPAYYVGRKLCICLYEQGVGVKLPEHSAAALLQTDPNAVPFHPLGKPKMWEWVQINLSRSGDYRQLRNCVRGSDPARAGAAGEESTMTNTNWIDRQEYPFESHYFDVPAGRLHYVDEGSGPPIVMVHGNPTWSYLYRHLIKRLRPEYRCVAPDHLGFGLSNKPRDWSYLPAEHAANLTALIDGLGLKDITLVVQDWGGPIGLSYAVTHPENVARLIIMNTWAWPVNRDWYYIAFSGFMGGPVGRWLIQRYNFFARSVMRQAFGDQRKLTPAAHEHYLRALPTAEDRKGCYVFPQQIVKATPWLSQLWSNAPVLKGKPTLIIWGMKDIAFREKELMRWEGAFPEAHTVRLSSVGHFVQEEAPNALAAAAVPFLQDTTPA